MAAQDQPAVVAVGDAAQRVGLDTRDNAQDKARENATIESGAVDFVGPSHSAPNPSEPDSAGALLLHQLKPSLRWAGFAPGGLSPSKVENSSDSLVA
ncbi:MAG: hypothetical protein AAF991_13120 [Pseudomonadota bacterium]